MSDLTLEQALILLDESRQHNAAMLDRLYESLGIDSRDGEIRFKWAMVEIENIKRERNAALAREAELVAQVEVLCAEKDYFKNGMAELQDYIDKLDGGKS